MKEIILDTFFEEGCLKFLDAKTVPNGSCLFSTNSSHLAKRGDEGLKCSGNVAAVHKVGRKLSEAFGYHSNIHSCLQKKRT